MLREEVEEAVRSLKAGKSSRVDNVPSELFKNVGEATTTALTALCQKDLGDEGMAKRVDTIARHTFIKEKQAESNIRTFAP